MVRTSLLSLALIAPAVLSATSFSQTTPPDKVLSTKTIRGKVVRFETGDYVHAIIKTTKGEELSFFISGPGTDYYLALNANKVGSFRIQTVKSHIEEAGGVMEIERISWAKIGKQSSSEWFKAQRKKYSFEQMEQKYGPLVQKLHGKENDQ